MVRNWLTNATGLVAFGLPLLALCGPARADDAPHPELMRQLAATWQRHREEVQTAGLDVGIYRAGHESVTYSLNELQALLAPLESDSSLPSTGIENFLRDLRAKLAPPVEGVQWFWGETVEVTLSGAKISERWAPSTAIGTAEKVNVFDGSHEVQFDPTNNQYTLFAGRTNTSLMDIGTLRFTPFYDEDQLAEKFTVTRAADGAVEFHSPSEKLTVEWPSAVVRDHTMLDAQGGARQWRRQYRLVTYDDGIVLPTVSLQASFKDGQLGLISLYHMRRADLNKPVAEESFVVRNLPQTRVVDMRKGDNEYAMYMTEGAGRNVLEVPDTSKPIVVDQIVDPLADGNAPTTGSGGRAPAWLGFFALGAVLIYLSYVTMRRRHKDANN